MADNEIMLEACGNFKKFVADESKRPEVRKQNFSQFRDDLLEGFRRGHISTYDKSWDFHRMFEEIVPADARKALTDKNSSQTLIEHGMDAMTSTMFPELFGVTTTVGMLELCNPAPYNLSGYCGTATAGCNQTDFVGMYDIGQVVDDSEQELEETQFYAVGGSVKISQLKRSKKKFAHAMTREMLCADGIELIRQMMRNGSMRLMKHRNRKLAQALFGLYPYGQNPFPFIKDDIPYRSHYTGQNSGFPWVNAMIGNRLDGSFRPFYFIEEMLDEQKDPYTNQPVNCTYQDILVMDAMAADKARMGLGMVKLEWNLPGAPTNAALRDASGTALSDPSAMFNSSSARLTQDRTSGLNFSRILTDRYLREAVRTWYMDVLKLSAAHASDAAHNTYAVGDFSSLKWVTEWPEETLERQGPDTWEYFNQEVLYSVKFMEKADPMWTNPHGVIINWPDLSTYTLTNFFAAYNASTGTVAKITGVDSGTASTANLFWY